MRFAVVAAAFAGAALAHYDEPESTLYTTKYYTITACPATVTDCPAKVTSSVIPLTTSTVYTTKVYTITSCKADVPDCPAHSTQVVTKTEAISTTICPVEYTTPYKNHTYTKPHGSKPVETEDCTESLTTHTKAPACPTYSVKTIHTSITTVIPTVVYETVSIPCPTYTKPANGTNPKPTKPVTAGAASMAGSVVLAVAAGAVALLL